MPKLETPVGNMLGAPHGTIFDSSTAQRTEEECHVIDMQAALEKTGEAWCLGTALALPWLILAPFISCFISCFMSCSVDS